MSTLNENLLTYGPMEALDKLKIIKITGVTFDYYNFYHHHLESGKDVPSPYLSVGAHTTPEMVHEKLCDKFSLEEIKKYMADKINIKEIISDSPYGLIANVINEWRKVQHEFVCKLIDGKGIICRYYIFKDHEKYEQQLSNIKTNIINESKLFGKIYHKIHKEYPSSLNLEDGNCGCRIKMEIDHWN